jgi:predicted metal-binding membrane protein
VTLARRALWRHPEWTGGALAVAAWFALAVHSQASTSPAMPGMAAMPGMDMSNNVAHPVLTSLAPWLVMATAMMIPAVLPTVRNLALMSLWRRRQRTVALFLAGYLGVWTVFGIAALRIAALGAPALDIAPSALVVALLIIAALWQFTSWKRRSLRARHLLLPLPQRGARADLACAVAGTRHALWCVVGCWPVMLAMAVGDVRLAVVAVLTLTTVAESAARPSRRFAPLGSVTLLAAAFVFAVG